MKLVHFQLAIRRSATVHWMAVIEEWQWKLIRKAIDEKWTLWFSEVAGKYSEVEIELEDEDIKILSEDETEIALFRKWFPEDVGWSLMWQIEGWLETHTTQEEYDSLMKELGNPEYQ